MSGYLASEDFTGPGWHPTATALAAATRAPGVEAHLASCLRCRAHALRLAAEGRQRVDKAAVASLLPDSPVLPEAILDAALDTPPQDRPAPAEGELWRARNRDDARPGAMAVLVWIRRVFAESALVLPVVLDVEMADDESLLLEASDSSLGIRAAVLTGVDAEILAANLTTRIGPLAIAEDVAAVRQAARGKAVLPGHVRTGPPIVRDDDQRLDFRQAVGETVAALGPISSDEPDEPQDSHDPLALLEALRDLAYYEPGLRVEPASPSRPLFVDARHTARPLAAVHHLSTCVIVAVLSGDEPAAALTGSDVAGACLSLLGAHPEADSVAVCAAEPDWPAVLLGPADTGPAIGVPSGGPVRAGAPAPPLDLVTALRKHFDGARDRWDDAAPVRFDDAAAALGHARAIGAERSRGAVEEIRNEGARAVIPSKRAGYAAVGDTAVDAVKALIDAVLAGEDPASAVDGFIGGDR